MLKIAASIVLRWIETLEMLTVKTLCFYSIFYVEAWRQPTSTRERNHCACPTTFVDKGLMDVIQYPHNQSEHNYFDHE